MSDCPDVAADALGTAVTASNDAIDVTPTMSVQAMSRAKDRRS